MPLEDRDRQVVPSAARLDIQGLRALAVGLVILDHVMLRPSGGFVGVDVFFVVSGFLITGLLVREHDRSGRISIRRFYARRARRILPVSLLVLVLTVAAAFVLFSVQRAWSVFIDGVWTAFFAANWRMALTEVDYFQSALPPSPLQHYWSLSVEEQFYFVWPALMLGVFAMTARIGRGSRGRRLMVALALLLGISVTSFAFSVLQTPLNPEVAYFSTLTRTWELGVGAALAFVVQWVTRVPPALRVGLAYLGLATILVSAVQFSPATPFPGSAALLPVLGAALVIFAGHGAASGYDRAMVPLTNPVANYLGNISYSLYLWHFPIVVFALEFLPRGATYYVIVLALTLVLSVLSYHLVENPVRRSRWLEPTGTRSSRNAIVLTAVAAVVASVAVVAVYPAAEKTAATTTVVVATVGGSCDGAAVRMQPDCSGRSSDELLPARDEIALDTDGAFDPPCWRNHQAPPTSCSFGSESAAAVRVALVGDSHAAMYLPALEDIAADRGWYLEAHVGWGCQWIVTLDEDCSAQQAAAQERFVDGEPFDLIVTVASRHVTSEWGAQQLDAARAAWTEVANRGTRIAVISDVPMPSESAIECVQPTTIDVHDNDCGTAESEALSMADVLPSLAATVPNASLIDLMSLYCWDGFCPSVIGSVAVYRDNGGHITATWARTTRPTLEDRLLGAMS